MAKRKKQKQQTLEATLGNISVSHTPIGNPLIILTGRPRVRNPITTPKSKAKSKNVLGSPAIIVPAREMMGLSRAPPSSSVHSSQVFGSARKRRVARDDSSSEDTSEDDDVVALPVKGVKRAEKRDAPVSSSSRGSSAEGEPKGKNNRGSDDVDDVDDVDDDDGGDDDDDDEPLVAPTLRRKRPMISDDSDEGRPRTPSPAKRRRLIRRNAASSPVRTAPKETGDYEKPAPASAIVSRTRRKPLTQKEKARELLRRKRAGEVINEEDEESPTTDDGEPARAMYDTDSDHPALDEFEDDEEGVLDSEPDQKKGKKQQKAKKKNRTTGSDGDSDTSMDDFVVDDSDAPLGVPDDVYSGIPLEFTSHSHKPLKEHFRDAIEWLVQFKINPGFADKDHGLYRMAWKKLDDEVRGLATSKFASAAWKTDFYMALRARPYLEDAELPPAGLLETEKCGACGRAGHPAK
jgi:hypothetical protein